MMRYRLRTLLIAVSLVAVVLARVAYLKQRRDFHRQELQILLPKLAENRDVDYAANQIAILSTLPEMKIAANWHAARNHAIMAERYNHCMYRPWTTVGETVPNGR